MSGVSRQSVPSSEPPPESLSVPHLHTATVPTCWGAGRGATHQGEGGLDGETRQLAVQDTHRTGVMWVWLYTRLLTIYLYLHVYKYVNVCVCVCLFVNWLSRTLIVLASCESGWRHLRDVRYRDKVYQIGTKRGNLGLFMIILSYLLYHLFTKCHVWLEFEVHLLTIFTQKSPHKM